MRKIRRWIATGIALGLAASSVTLSASATTVDPFSLTAKQSEIITGLEATDLSPSAQLELIVEWEEARESLVATIDLGSGEAAVEQVTLSNGTVLEVGVEPAAAAGDAIGARALTGNYRIWGNNGLIFMEYWVQFGAAAGNSSLTTVVGSPWGMNVQSWAGTRWEGKSYSVVRRTETNAGGTCCAAQVRGITKVTYPRDIYQAEGGVEALVKNNKLSTYLY